MGDIADRLNHLTSDNPLGAISRAYLISRLTWLMVCIFAGLSALGLSVLGVHSLWNLPYDGGFATTRQGTVNMVRPHGTAYRIGIREGDVLLAVDGKPLDQLSNVYVGKHPGDVVQYLVKRHGRTFRVSLTLAEPHRWEQLPLFDVLALAMVFWLTGTVAYLFHSIDVLVRRFFLLCQICACVLATFILTDVRWTWAFPLYDALLLLLAPVAIDFHTRFPISLRGRTRRIIMLPAYGVACALIVWTLANLYLHGPLDLPPELTAISNLFVVSALFLIVCLEARPLVTNHLKYTEAGKRSRVILWGTVFSLLPLMTLSAIPWLVNAKPLVGFPWTVPFLALAPVSYALAVLKGNLGGVDKVVDRALVCVLAPSVAYTALLGVLPWIWKQLERAGWSPQETASVSILLVGIAFVFLPSRVVGLVNRYIYDRRYDFRSLVLSTTDELSGASSLDDLLKRLSKIAGAMHFEGSLLLARKGDELTETRTSWEGVPRYPAQIPVDSQLGRLLESTNRPLPRDEVITRLDSAAVHPVDGPGHSVQLHEAQIWLPLMGERRLQGVLLLGKRRGDQVLMPEDEKILRTIASQAGVVLQRVLLVDTLRQVREQLVRDADSERTRVSRELHDGPLGALFAALQSLDRLQKRTPEVANDPSFHASVRILDGVVSEIREVCKGLHTSVPETMLSRLGLLQSIESHAKQFRQANPYTHLDIAIQGREDYAQHVRLKLGDRKSIELFAIYREALNNVSRHSGATWVRVSLTFGEDKVTLTVSDDGRGFQVPEDWTDLEREGHFGLKGINEGVRSINGKISLRSCVGKGTQLQVVIPLERQAVQQSDGVTHMGTHKE